MRIKNSKLVGTIVGVVAAIVIYLAACAISWICTCGLIKLITLCFGWTFSWRIATGVWLIMFLARIVLNRTVHVKR